MKIDAEPRLAASLAEHGPLQANSWVIKPGQAASYLDFVQNVLMIEFNALADLSRPMVDLTALVPPIPAPTLPAGCDADAEAAAAELVEIRTQLKNSM